MCTALQHLTPVSCIGCAHSSLRQKPRAACCLVHSPGAQGSAPLRCRPCRSAPSRWRRSSADACGIVVRARRWGRRGRSCCVGDARIQRLLCLFPKRLRHSADAWRENLSLKSLLSELVPWLPITHRTTPYDDPGAASLRSESTTCRKAPALQCSMSHSGMRVQHTSLSSGAASRGGSPEVSTLEGSARVEGSSFMRSHAGSGASLLPC